MLWWRRTAEQQGRTVTSRVPVRPLQCHVDPRTGDLDPWQSWGPDCIEFAERVLGWELTALDRRLYVWGLEKRKDGTGLRFEPASLVLPPWPLMGKDERSRWWVGLKLWLLAVTAARTIPDAEVRDAALR
jgi:hypothetical protein